MPDVTETKPDTESAQTIFPLLSLIPQVRSFIRTRQAVRKGEPLWDLSKRETEQRQLMGPWSFNLFESFLAGLPAGVVLWLMSLVSYPDPELVNLSGTEAEFARILSTLSNVFLPFALPATTFVAALLISKGALSPFDRTPERVHRSRRAYLYLDGAYGLALQALTSALLLVVPSTLEGPQILHVIGFVTLVYERREIGSRLLEANGYDSSDTPGEVQTLFKKPAPWREYIFTTVYVVPLALLVVFAGFVIVIFAGAFVLLFVKSLLAAANS